MFAVTLKSDDPYLSTPGPFEPGLALHSRNTHPIHSFHGMMRSFCSSDSFFRILTYDNSSVSPGNVICLFIALFYHFSFNIASVWCCLNPAL